MIYKSYIIEQNISQLIDHKIFLFYGENDGLKNEDVSVIQFSASWCGPCKALKPVMDKLSDEYKDKANFYIFSLIECLAFKIFHRIEMTRSSYSAYKNLFICYF